MKETVGIVLAGGLSRRFGSPKAFAKLGNEYFYKIAVEAMSASCEEVVIVTLPELMERFRNGENVMTDKVEYAGLGPLAGILSAMESVEANRYVILPCDMPFIDDETIAKLITHHNKGVTAVTSNGRYHPLVSIWDSQMKSAVKAALENNQLSVMKLLSISNTAWVQGSILTDDERLMFTNVNTPETLERG